MNNDKNIPLSAISAGKSMEEVLEKYMSVFGEVKAISIEQGNLPDDATTDAMMVSAYRIYLLGVEDGMNA